MSFGCLGRTSALWGGLLWQSLQSRVVPYVVEVDRLGEARAVEPVARDYQPTDPQVAWFLSRFIGDIRPVLLDPVLIRQDWLHASAFENKAGTVFFGAFSRSPHSFVPVGERAISIQWTT